MLKQELSKQGMKPNPPPTEQNVEVIREHRKIPVKRLVSRLGLSQYDKPAPLTEKEYSVAEVRIPVKQHVGAPGTPVVQVGQMVKRGEVVAAAPAEGLGANVHASISGRVTEVGDRIVLMMSEGGRQ